MIVMARLAPTKSATEFPVGTIRKGQDGKKWKVIKTKNGIQRWQRMYTMNVKDNSCSIM